MAPAGRGGRKRKRGSGKGRVARSRAQDFKIGDQVEARSDEDGFIGVWYCAEVVDVEPGSISATVEYDQLLDEQGHPLQEAVLLRNLRPHPPDFPKKSWLKGECVEAYDKDGWWEGIVTHVTDSSGPVLVYFYSTGEVMGFPPAQLRRRQCWQEGKWSDVTQVGSSSAVSKEDCMGVQSKNPSASGRSAKMPLQEVLNPYPEKIFEAEALNQELLCQKYIDNACDGAAILCAQTAAQDDARKANGNNIGTAVNSLQSKDHLFLAASAFLESSKEPQELEPVGYNGCKVSAAIDEWTESQAHKENGTITNEHDLGDIGCSGNALTGCGNHCSQTEQSRRLEYGAYRMLLQALHSKGSLDWKQERLLAEVRCQLDITSLENATALKEVLFSKEMTDKMPQ